MKWQRPMIGRAFTQEVTQGRLLVHAELLALDQADRLVAMRKGPAVLYTTLEPCLMCLGAASVAVVDRVVFGLRSDADGAAELSRLWDEHRAGEHLPHVRLPPLTGGVGADEARGLFERFVASRPSPDDPLARWAATLLVADGPSVGPESPEPELVGEPLPVDGSGDD